MGQGDAFLIIDGSAQILIDGGPNNKVTDCLSRYVPFWDRKLELVILTHPEADHFTGLIDVFKRYRVETFLGNGLKNSTQSYQVLEDLVRREGSQTLFPNTVNHLRIGLIYLDLLWPTSDHLSTHTDISNGYNNFSLVFTLKRGDFKALFTGDIEPEISSQIPRLSDVDVLKIPHHGSKNGLTEELLNATTPEKAIISVGKNQWGHPHLEVLKMLEDANVEIHRTDLEGDIILDLD